MSAFYGTPITPAPGEPLIQVGEGWDPRTGPYYTFEWRGREAEVRAQMILQKLLGNKIELNKEDDYKWVLRVTASKTETTETSTPLTVKWSLKRNLVEKNLWEHPRIAAAFHSILDGKDFVSGAQTMQRIARMKKDFDAFIRGDGKTTNEAGEEVDLTSDVLAAHIIVLELTEFENDFISFLTARLRGVEVLPTWSWVLRKTVTIFEGSALKPNKDNVNRMFTLAALKNHEELGDEEVIGQLPDGFWLKTPVEVDRSEGGGPDKWDFEQEYWHAETYEPSIYGAAIEL